MALTACECAMAKILGEVVFSVSSQNKIEIYKLKNKHVLRVTVSSLQPQLKKVCSGKQACYIH